MEGVEAIRPGKSSLAVADSERAEKLKERLERLLREAAEVEVELSRAKGAIKGVPHYSLIEGRAHELGRQLRREVQQREMSELVAAQAATAKCPECHTVRKLQVKKRNVKPVDGETPRQELVGHCPWCRRSFFPATRGIGF
jgi:hypothetical protein